LPGQAAGALHCAGEAASSSGPSQETTARRCPKRCGSSAKARDEELKVIAELKVEPKTKQMAEILAALGADSSALVVTSEPQENVIKAARNLEGVKTMPANLLNVLDILSHKMVLMTVSAVRKAEELWGEKKTQEVNHAPL